MTSLPESRNGSGRSSTARTMVKSDVVAPMPSAITSTETMAKPGERSNVRVPYFRSRTNCSSQIQLQTARVCSRIRVGLPKARRAA